eukprot:Gb_25201 [translate_table: standard]
MAPPLSELIHRHVEGINNAVQYGGLVVVKYTKLFINGEFVDSILGNAFETCDPRTMEVIMCISEATDEDADLAVKVVRNDFDNRPWSRMCGYERGRVLSKYADLVEQHIEEIAALETLDTLRRSEFRE